LPIPDISIGRGTQWRTFTAQRKGNKFFGPQGQVVGTVLADDNVTIDSDPSREGPQTTSQILAETMIARAGGGS